MIKVRKKINNEVKHITDVEINLNIAGNIVVKIK